MEGSCEADHPHARALKLNAPAFVYSHAEGMSPLCEEMRSAGFPLIHICMDYPEPYQYELIELSISNPGHTKIGFSRTRGEIWRKDSVDPTIHSFGNSDASRQRDPQRAGAPRGGAEAAAWVPWTDLRSLESSMLREFLTQNRNWHFIYFGESKDLELPNAHAIDGESPEELPGFVAPSTWA